VKKDEEEARKKEEQEDARMRLADSEARLNLLRERGGAKELGKKNDDDDLNDILARGTEGAASSSTSTSGKNINFFEDLEQASMMNAIRVSKKSTPAESEKGVALAPSTKDLNPWYSEKKKDGTENEEEDKRRKRDVARKFTDDPLTSITQELASRSSASSTSTTRYTRSSGNYPESSSNAEPPQVRERLTRESSERQRALELIRRKKRELEGSETPSSVHGGGYGDVFNRKEVEEAHRERERRWDHRDRRHDRGWDANRSRRW